MEQCAWLDYSSAVQEFKSDACVHSCLCASTHTRVPEMNYATEDVIPRRPLACGCDNAWLNPVFCTIGVSATTVILLRESSLLSKLFEDRKPKRKVNPILKFLR